MRKFLSVLNLALLLFLPTANAWQRESPGRTLGNDSIGAPSPGLHFSAELHSTASPPMKMYYSSGKVRLDMGGSGYMLIDGYMLIEKAANSVYIVLPRQKRYGQLSLDALVG